MSPDVYFSCVPAAHAFSQDGHPPCTLDIPLFNPGNARYHVAMKISAAILAALGLVVSLYCNQAIAVDDYAACRLPDMHIRRDVGLGFPRIPFRLKTTGEVRFTVLFVDFSDAPASRTPQDVMAIISPQAEQFFKAVSYGKLNLALMPNYKWIRMNKASSDYHMSRNTNSFDAHRAYIQEAVYLAGTSIDYAKTDAILVLANPAVKVIDFGPGFSPSPGYGVTAGGREIDNGATSGSDLTNWGWPWFNHEIGHTMSLIDLAGPLPGNQLWYTYTGDFSVMGNPSGSAPEYFGWERWQLGWLDDDQVICAGKATTRTQLSPIERVGGTKMLIVPTGTTTAVVIESRHAEGYDHAIPKSGPLVYTIDTRLSSHDGAIRVFPVSDTDSHHLQSPLALGETLHIDKVSITYVSGDAGGDTVEVQQAN